MSNPAIQLAETIQTASINRAPSPAHDLNPSTAASSKQPVTVSHPPTTRDADLDDVDDVISESAIRPLPRRTNLPPLPDLRFEQSYLASISRADSSGAVAWITLRDQVMLPLLQGTLWTLALSGWRFWNRNASYSGHTVGSKLRVWWYGVNDWTIPGKSSALLKPATGDGLADTKLADEVGEFYKEQFSSAGQD